MDLPANKYPRTILQAICGIFVFCGIFFLLFGPGIRIPIGTCGPDHMPMIYKNEIEPAFTMSFLHVFGESEPAFGPDMPPLLNYSSRKEAVNTLMDKVQVTGSEDSIIGLYEFPGSRLLLLSQDKGITEILETDQDLRTYNLVPGPVGSRRVDINETGWTSGNAYNSSYEITMAVQKTDLVLPGRENETAPLYIVKKTATDNYLYPGGRHFASISTTGTFYVIYGQRVERVVNSSRITVDPQWTLCSEEWERSGEGGPMGELKHTVRLAHSSDRILRSRVITTGAFIQVHDANMGSTDQWMSRDSTGCGC